MAKEGQPPAKPGPKPSKTKVWAHRRGIFITKEIPPDALPSSAKSEPPVQLPAPVVGMDFVGGSPKTGEWKSPKPQEIPQSAAPQALEPAPRSAAPPPASTPPPAAVPTPPPAKPKEAPKPVGAAPSSTTGPRPIDTRPRLGGPRAAPARGFRGWIRRLFRLDGPPQATDYPRIGTPDGGEEVEVTEARKAYVDSIIRRKPVTSIRERRFENLAQKAGLNDMSENGKPKVTGRLPLVLMVLDGYGISPTEYGNAIAAARPLFIDELAARFPHTTLQAAGEAVGLPPGQIGNSEVGHMHIGAGRLVRMGLSLINQEVHDGTLKDNGPLKAAVQRVKENPKTHLHIFGLLSPGGVHSHQEHIFALMRMAAASGVKPVVHAFGDGRDVAQKSILESLAALAKVCQETGGVLASLSGRYYAMDRDGNFERTMRAYEAITGNSDDKFTDPAAFVNAQYKKGVTDEFLPPAVNLSVPEESFLRDGDSVIFANFRPDRARQLSHVVFGSSAYTFSGVVRKERLYFVTMAQYEGIVPSAVAYPPTFPEGTLGETLSKANLRQLRIAETEKYAHVTFFLDGGREVMLPKMAKELIPSPKVATYDLKPAMSAVEVTDRLLGKLRDFDVVVINYANPDMVGHTGSLLATTEAVKVVDAQVKRVYDAVSAAGGVVFITADHGNAEVMIDENGKPQTAHTTNPVPFIATDASVVFTGPGTLANIAPTLLDYLGVPKPAEMTSLSLLKPKES